MSDLVGYEELNDAVRDSLSRLKESGPAEEMKSFGVDYEDILPHIKEMFEEQGPEGTALWTAGFHAGLCLAMRHWDYRIPNGDDE